jgi:tetratricopeptide (TPR) repeat protein
MSRIVAHPGVRLYAVSALIALLSLVPARAEDDVLSDRLTDQILMNKLDLVRKLDNELEQRTRELNQNPTVERANKLRELLKSRAATYESLEDFERAEGDYNALIEVNPINPNVYSDRGYFYMRQGRYSEAVRDFTTGSRIAPAQSSFNYGAGRALSRMGDYATAIDHYNEAIRLAPRDGVLLLSRAEAYVQVRKYTEARADYDHAIALGLRREGERFFVYFGRGYANICLGDYDAAVRDMDTALTLRPGMVNAVVWRGFAREKLGQREKALADYEWALRNSPNDDWIRTSIKRIRS